MRIGSASLLLVALTRVSAFAGASALEGGDPSYSPRAGQDFAQRVWFGDTHLHTNLSPDAAAGGNRDFGHDQAYRLARGDVVTAHNGTPVQLNRPLDFLVVADHAEYMGLFPGLDAADPELLATEQGQRWHEMLNAGADEAANILIEFGQALRGRLDLIDSPAFTKSTWHTVIDKADAYNQPGAFTAFTGYEWSSGRGGGNMHRVVIFRDGAERTKQVVPFSSFDGDRPRELWAYLQRYETRTGGEAFAIPHNSNVSSGLMLRPTDSDGQAMTVEYAKDRGWFEPLLEVTQFKGDSETHPYVSPDDEFADYESWDVYAGFSNRPHEDRMFAGEYARPALRTGLAVAGELGVNPFQFGMIGSTDSHTGIPSPDENNFWGKFTWHEPSRTRALERFVNIPDIMQYEWEMAASGLAAVWARDNTRGALFDAMRRRETYATTGPRMTVRLFGGWEFGGDAVERPDWVRHGYEYGVPMGGVLTPPGDGKRAPAFIVSALKDPDGANLDRVQIVKGWLRADGTTAERVHNVVLSGGRTVQSDGTVAAVGSTVDVTTATYRNTIGSATLSAVWRDPDFDPDQASFYYARVIEIPTPRWTAHDAAFFDIDMPDDVPMTTQERAYTSPIWYVP